MGYGGGAVITISDEGREMIQDKTIDETLVELARTMKALQALRAARKSLNLDAYEHQINTGRWSPVAEHAAAKRASLDLTRKLSDLRAGR